MNLLVLFATVVIPALAGSTRADPDLLVIDAATHRVARFAMPGGVPLGDLVTARSGGLVNPRFATIGPDGALYVSSELSSSVMRYDRITGDFIDEFIVRFTSPLQRPAGLTFGPSGNLYIASRNNWKILEYDGATGAFVRDFAMAPLASLQDPFDIVFDEAGDLLVICRGSSSVTRLDGDSGERIDTYMAPTVLASGLAGAAYHKGRLYICGSVSDNVLVVEEGQPPVELIAVGAGGMDAPFDIIVAPDGALLVSCGGGPGSVMRFDAQTGEFLGIVIERGAGDVFAAGGMTLAAASCYADCDGSGSLDFFDFLCFQNQFAAGEPEADCDGSGSLDFFDFLCFQNAYAAGCP